MNYCYNCGCKLISKELENEGLIPFCTKCNEYRFPIFSTAVSMIVQNPLKNKILLIKQYNKPNFVLVAGYINKGENAETAVIREIKEEIGIAVADLKYNKSRYFKPTNTLMLNFSCVAKTEELSNITNEVDYAEWFDVDAAKENIMKNSLAEEFLLSYLDK